MSTVKREVAAAADIECAGVGEDEALHKLRGGAVQCQRRAADCQCAFAAQQTIFNGRVQNEAFINKKFNKTTKKIGYL